LSGCADKNVSGPCGPAESVEARRDGEGDYAVLARRHYRHVFALCLGMLANAHDAEDIAQETMLKGFQSIKGLTRPEGFQPWILRIAKNLCVDLLRRRKRLKMLPVESEPTTGAETHENHDLEHAIRRLPQEFRLPLTMFYFEHRDAGSIAGTLGISQSLVYERLRVARESLHELLTERGTHE
jgi:RNA polymerase sigma-70 factor (ECF subfamily)